ncbi:DUF5050 domain-containing protein [Paenibacillus spiritus]|uniref:DUF5050 domain-containing protein n=1 Tax=Paenibacillus spiritus TaxID=2496557 RepID=A0A5J5FTT0_9BACL|nr:DUF5050 domain-containing protein [Paenibacillus spiritus]KAA8996336.1 DUF5050 domain-containing protein [Paenibacillus spiritus]
MKKLFLTLSVATLLSGCNAGANEDWIYETTGAGVVKYDTVGSNYTYISPVEAKEVIVNKNWLYYISEENGMIKKTELNKDQEIKIDTKLYTYISKKDNKQYSLIQRPMKEEALPTDEIIVLGQESESLAISGDTLFFSNVEEGGSIYKVKTDGSELTEILDDVAEDIVVSGDWVYYSNDKSLRSIYKVRTDGSDKGLLMDDYASWFDVGGNWIYYKTGDTIYKIKDDGSSKTEVIEDDNTINEPHLFGNWIYYLSSEGYFKVKTDGSGKEKLS